MSWVRDIMDAGNLTGQMAKRIEQTEYKPTTEEMLAISEAWIKACAGYLANVTEAEDGAHYASWQQRMDFHQAKRAELLNELNNRAMGSEDRPVEDKGDKDGKAG